MLGDGSTNFFHDRFIARRKKILATQTDEGKYDESYEEMAQIFIKEWSARMTTFAT